MTGYGARKDEILELLRAGARLYMENACWTLETPGSAGRNSKKRQADGRSVDGLIKSGRLEIIPGTEDELQLKGGAA